MKLLSTVGAALAVILSASAASALPIASIGDGASAVRGSSIVEVKSMPSRSVYHSRSRHSRRGLRTSHRY